MPGSADQEIAFLATCETLQPQNTFETVGCTLVQQALFPACTVLAELSDVLNTKEDATCCGHSHSSTAAL